MFVCVLCMVACVRFCVCVRCVRDCLRVRVSVCMRARLCECGYVRPYLYMCVSMWGSLRIRNHICMQVFMHVRVNVCLRTCMYVATRVRVCA